MILSRCKYKIIILIFAISLLPSISFADNDYNVWDYNVLEESSSFIDIDRTTADVDYEKREIKLPKLPVSDVVKFTNEDGYDYVVLEKDGFQHYGFDGEKLIPINSLSKSGIESPLGIAYNSYQPSYFVSQLSEDGGVVKNFVHSDEGMIESPILSTLNLDYIYSLSTFESGELAILTEESISTYAKGESDLVYLPALSKEGIEDPISIATGQDYQFAVLTKEKIEYYQYQGDKINVPIFEMILDTDVKNPKAIVLDNDSNTTFLLDEKEVYAYTLEGTSMNYNAAFSINVNLNKPQAMAFNRGTKDIIIIDEITEEERFIAKYFMFDGNEYIELNALSQEIEDIAVGNRYRQEGTFITNTFSTNSPYIDLLRVRAFTETPKGTEMEFFMTYDVDAFIAEEDNEGEESEEDEEEIEINWIPLWRVSNNSNDDVNSGSVYMKGRDLGNNEFAYPTAIYEDNLSEDVGIISDDDIKIDENGKVTIDVGKNYESSFWLKLDIGDKRDAIDSGEYKEFRIKVVLKTIDSELTPKIFAPIGTNNDSGISESDSVAFRIEGNAEPLGPIIDIKDPNKEEEPKPPISNDGKLPRLPERDGFEWVEGWIYTTTPTFSWEFIDDDLEYNEYEQQMAYQLILLANKGGDWRIAYDSGVVEDEKGEENWFDFPTTIDNLHKNGPMWSTGTNHFMVAVRTWDYYGAVSDLYLEENNEFKVLAFERPRIANVVYPVGEEIDESKQPILNDISSHKMIVPGMVDADLPYAKAGAEVTMLVDSVGPIITVPLEVPLFYAEVFEQNTPMFLTEASYEPSGINGTWMFKFFTTAPIEIMPDDTVVKGSFIGKSEVGGTTVLYIPNYADGIVSTKETIYKDWQVIIQGRDK